MDQSSYRGTYMAMFYDHIVRMAEYVRDRQVPNIVRAMNEAYRRKSAGGAIYSHVLVGHFAMFAASPGIPGQPFVLPQRADRNVAADYAKMKEGDFLLTNGPSLVNPDKATIPEVGPNEARVRGAYTAGITCSYVRFYKTPIGALVPVKMSTSLEDICDLVIDSGCPWSCGVIDTPEIPFRIVSSSGISQFLVYWACTAALCAQIGSGGKDDGAAAARDYLDKVIASFRAIEQNEFDTIDRVARQWTEHVLRYKGKARLLVYGAPQEGTPYEGTQNMFVNDAYETAAGTMIMQPYELYKTDLKPTDIVLIGAIAPGNSDEIQVAKVARQIGATTVAFGPFSEQSEGPRLADHVDVAIDTHSGDGAGVLDVQGFDEKVCPISGLSGNLVLWLLTAQWTWHMVQRNETPYYWQNYLEVGAVEYDDLTHAKFVERGY
ncbi:MAG: hypothetical protein M3Q69_04615 [Acidobacteriota bacterium]|nr:hypothetical protein [Acidobacteriota bacterium]